MKKNKRIIFQCCLIICCLKFGAGCKCTCIEATEPDGTIKQWEIIPLASQDTMIFVSADKDTIKVKVSREKYRKVPSYPDGCARRIEALFQLEANYYVDDTLNPSHQYGGDGIISWSILQDISRDNMDKQVNRILPKPIATSNYTTNGIQYMDVNMYDTLAYPHAHGIRRFIIKQNSGITAIYVDNKLYEKK